MFLITTGIVGTSLLNILALIKNIVHHAFIVLLVE